jgi:hypothetical protein
MHVKTNSKTTPEHVQLIKQCTTDTSIAQNSITGMVFFSHYGATDHQWDIAVTVIFYIRETE